MEKKQYLLPYSCQKLGWWLLGAFLLGALVFAVFELLARINGWGEVQIPQLASLVMVTLVTCCPVLGLILLCLSREKREDEYIQSLRARSLFLVVVYAFILVMLKTSLEQFLVAYMPDGAFRQLTLWIQYLTNIPLLAVIYLVLFKGSLLLDYLKSRKYGE